MTMERAIQYLTIVVITVIAISINDAHAHGRLVEPISRFSMWRYGFSTPVNYNDNQLYCGGKGVQWNTNGGKCGICGDPYNGVRENEAGGKYATGTISRHYVEGQTIKLTLDITTNHGGYFEFRICPNNDTSRPATESCLNKHLLTQPNRDTKWRFPEGNRKFSLMLVLPRGLTCTQCVMQWKWTTASTWDCDANNNCCKGCGPQETFMGCSDVAITSSSLSSSSSS